MDQDESTSGAISAGWIKMDQSLEPFNAGWIKMAQS
jgi:hypothetical protein